jgi:hypothetical protein
LTTVSGIARYGYDSSGVLRTDLTTVSGIARYGYDSSGVLRTDLTTVSGIARYGYDSSGVLNTKIYDTEIYNLGTISGSIPLNWEENKTIQAATLNGFPITFSAGTGWPTTYVSRDLLLKLTTDVNTDITWNIIGSNWYSKPSGSVLTSGEYIFVLRAFGSGIINGFYIGQNTGSL